MNKLSNIPIFIYFNNTNKQKLEKILNNLNKMFNSNKQNTPEA